ncbi:hypothetical protein BDW72DRAFT_179795 [Aspergillus terricola var. indicus]
MVRLLYSRSESIARDHLEPACRRTLSTATPRRTHHKQISPEPSDLETVKLITTLLASRSCFLSAKQLPPNGIEFSKLGSLESKCSSSSKQ